MELHLLPVLGGNLRLSQLTLPALRAFEDKLSVDRSSVMVRRVLVRSAQVLADAQEYGSSATTWCAISAEARNRRDRQRERRHSGKLKIGVDIPSPDEVRQLLAHADPRWQPLIATAVFTGLRASELRGLRWQDVDLKRDEVHVRQRADRYNQIGRTEVGSRGAQLPLPPGLVRFLREHRLKSGSPRPGVPNGKGNIEASPTSSRVAWYRRCWRRD